ncbi:MAG TPA: alpha/beta hydrolase [Polyangia bacterium]|nr:alpha/beta hydrolase [Polyangia bacterium]
MKLPVIVDNPGGDNAVVLVPGGLMGWLSWEAHAARLAETRRVLRVQLLNVAHGYENRPLPPGYSVTMEADALAETLRAEGVVGAKGADLVAWSYGAEVALSFALRDPQRVRSLTLIEPPAVWVLRARGTFDEEAQQVARKLGSLGDEVSEDDLEMFAVNVGFCPPGKSPRQMAAWPLWARYRQALRSSRHAIDHADDLQAWRDFPRPVLLVKGRGSARFLHQIVDGLAAELPGARVLTLPGGHAPQIVSMDAFMTALAAFQETASAPPDAPAFPQVTTRDK